MKTFNLTSNPYVRAINILEKTQINYVIIGGFAVLINGVPRFTPDLNVIINLSDKEKIKKLLNIVNQYHLIPENKEVELILLSESQRNQFAKNKIFFSFYDQQAPSFSLDIMLTPPLPFNSIKDQFLEIKFNSSITGKIANIDLLIELKKLTNRGQDKEDIMNLNIIKAIQHNCESQVVNHENYNHIKEFYSKDISQKLSWLTQMLENLGNFCLR